MTLINEGEVNFLRDAGLTDLEFDVLIPSVQYSFAKYDDGFKSPASFTDHFEKLKTSKEPFQFIISRQMPDGKLISDTNMTVSMESYTVKEQASEGFDLIVSIKLKQYKEYGTKVVKVSNNQASVTNQRPETNSPAPKQETTYKVKQGDTLWNIAKEFYGDGSLYTAIYEVNKDKIPKPNMINIGIELNIPDKPSAKNTTQTKMGGKAVENTYNAIR
jgi:LysM repeat protein